jgi:molybdenum cofactor biosynthesis protein B
MTTSKEHFSCHVAIITVSDTRTEATDTSGQFLRQLCTQAGHQVNFYAIVPDDPQRIQQIFSDLDQRTDIDVILLTGGTGISPRDQTYEAVIALLEKRLDGFGELFRYLSYQEIGAAAMLSRAVAGVWHGRLVFSLPGSPAAVRLAMEQLILPQLSHALALVRGQTTHHPPCRHHHTSEPTSSDKPPTQPIFLRPNQHAQFSSNKMAKVTLYQSERFFLGLNCLEPGQEHQLHSHPGQDKAYLVLQGQGLFLLPQGEQPMQEGDMLVAPANVPHGIRNTGHQGLIVLVLMSPPP